MSYFFKKDSLKRKSFVLFLVVLLIIGPIFNLFFVGRAQAVWPVHIVIDTSPTGVLNAFANLADKIINAATLGIKIWEKANLILTEALKTVLINGLTNETIGFIQGANGGQPKFVTDLGNYLWGSVLYNLNEVLRAKFGNIFCPMAKPYFNLGLNIASRSLYFECIDLNSLAGRNDPWYAFDRFMLNPLGNDPYAALLIGVEKHDEELARREHQQELKYLASQGYVPQTKKTKKCILYDDQGNCVKYQEVITTPGKVYSDMVQNTADAHIKRIANAQRLEQIMTIIATSFIDKIVRAGENGLLEMSAKTESVPSSYYSGVGTSDVYNWLNWKHQSYITIKEKIIPTLEALKDCYSQKGDDTKVSSTEALILQYQSREGEMKIVIEKIEKDPSQYDPWANGSVSQAEQEYHQLEEDYKRYDRMLFDCYSKE